MKTIQLILKNAMKLRANILSGLLSSVFSFLLKNLKNIYGTKYATHRACPLGFPNAVEQSFACIPP